MKKTMLFSALLLFTIFPGIIYSQAATSKSEIKVSVDSLHQNIDIDFTPSTLVYNLLIHINDSTGQTIFLDNQYKFSGNYKKSIDMKQQKKGTYFLEIIEDNKHTNQKIVLK